ncbi:MAG: DUF2141 domain-containing protein [Gammaproteobacteria bacterium]|nr:DUF2141 domain-containing protein [Gammaproteobacteria bacterium]MDH5801623.1 DUF2141 domain-containing protein [Gammaproteobacteria bacterium]
MLLILKSLRQTFIWFVIFVPSLMAQTLDTQERNLTIHVGNLPDDTGMVVARLFRPGDDIFKTPFKVIKSHSFAKQSTLVFRDLEFGQYAVVVFQDKNANDDLDHNFLNLPAEPIGFSNNFTLGVFSGFPSFNKLKVNFDPEHESYQIDVH